MCVCSANLHDCAEIGRWPDVILGSDFTCYSCNVMIKKKVVFKNYVLGYNSIPFVQKIESPIIDLIGT